MGKTAIAIELAERLRAAGEDPVAISADALQVYRGLEVLTGAEDSAGHRLVGIRDVTEPFSVGEFMPLAHAEIDRALESGRRPIVVGGTGLYLRAALTNLDLKPPPGEGLREHWASELAARGPEHLHAELAERAPASAAAVDPTDSSRIVRSLELLDMGEGLPTREDSQLWATDTRRPTLLFGLVMEREALYERIDARVDEMVAAGAGEEVRRANAAGASPTARKALGFEQLLAGDVEGMKRRTRNYSKRQLTWLRKLPGIHVVDVTARDAAEVGSEIVERCQTGRVR